MTQTGLIPPYCSLQIIEHNIAESYPCICDPTILSPCSLYIHAVTSSCPRTTVVEGWTPSVMDVHTPHLLLVPKDLADSPLMIRSIASISCLLQVEQRVLGWRRRRGKHTRRHCLFGFDCSRVPDRMRLRSYYELYQEGSICRAVLCALFLGATCLEGKGNRFPSSLLMLYRFTRSKALATVAIIYVRATLLSSGESGLFLCSSLQMVSDMCYSSYLPLSIYSLFIQSIHPYYVQR